MNIESGKNYSEQVEREGVQEKPESESNPEVLLSEMQSRLMNFEKQGDDELSSINNTIGLDASGMEGVANELGVTRNLFLIAERAREAFEVAKEKMKQGTVIGLSLVSLLGASEAYAGQEGTIEIGNKNRAEGHVDKAGYDNKIKEIRNELWTDQGEKVYLVVKQGDRFSFTDASLVTNDNSAMMDVGKIRKCFEAGECESAELIHTHPLAASSGVDMLKMDKIKSGEIELAQMPPSITDITSLVTIQSVLGEKAGLLKNKVIDLTGEWEYGINKESEFVVLLKNARKDVRDLNADDLKTKLKLDSEEVAVLKRVVDASGMDIFKEHPVNSMEALASLLAKEKGGDKVIEKINTYLSEVSHKWQEQYPQSFAELSKAYSLETSLSGYYAPEAKQVLQEEQDIFKRNGFDVKYIPFNDNEKKKSE